MSKSFTAIVFSSDVLTVSRLLKLESSQLFIVIFIYFYCMLDQNVEF